MPIPNLSKLSPRQQQVLELMCQGLPTRLISERLALSCNTVKEHRAEILRRMEVNNTVELVQKVNALTLAAHLTQQPDLQTALAEPPDLLVVEDDDLYRELVVSSLKQAGFHCRGISDRAGVAQALLARKPDILVLDLNLGQDDGLVIARELRESQPRCGIIMMTTRGMVEQRIDGLATGADAYLVKPIDIRELVAVIINLHRRLTVSRYVSPT